MAWQQQILEDRVHLAASTSLAFAVDLLKEQARAAARFHPDRLGRLGVGDAGGADEGEEAWRRLMVNATDLANAAIRLLLELKQVGTTNRCGPPLVCSTVS